MSSISHEKERRWLINPANINISTLKGVKKEIVQGYFTRPGSEITIRARSWLQERRRLAEMTMKGQPIEGKEGVPELNVKIPYGAGKAMQMMALAKLAKTRICIPYQDKLFWEIDFFKDLLDGLIVAEIELPQMAHSITVPAYFGPEITGIRELSNVACAFNPQKALSTAKDILAGN